MTDKIQKIKDWISKTQDGLMDVNGNFENSSNEGAFHILTNLDYYIDSLQEEPKKCMYSKDDYTDEDRKILCDGCEEECEYNKKEEPVSEELGEAGKEWLTPQLDKSYADYGETKMMELTHFDGYAMLDAIEFGAKWQKENLWKPADSDDLPEIDREVIALLDNGKVVFAHRPPEYWDGKNIDIGKVTRYYPKTYGKGGWNIPNVKYWLDVELPKEIEL